MQASYKYMGYSQSLDLNCEKHTASAEVDYRPRVAFEYVPL